MGAFDWEWTIQAGGRGLRAGQKSSISRCHCLLIIGRSTYDDTHGRRARHAAAWPAYARRAPRGPCERVRC